MPSGLSSILLSLVQPSALWPLECPIFESTILLLEDRYLSRVLERCRKAMASFQPFGVCTIKCVRDASPEHALHNTRRLRTRLSRLGRRYHARGLCRADLVIEAKRLQNYYGEPAAHLYYVRWSGGGRAKTKSPHLAPQRDLSCDLATLFINQLILTSISASPICTRHKVSFALSNAILVMATFARQVQVKDNIPCSNTRHRRASYP